ncbi:hypothetical protein [Leclercia sp.]|uniref:hypothetical protein n=1 Tax=Leclercia sp. TaxID=1898428 RepID=UPI0028A9AC9D|nr:hypothetical protein [Leclercia sp.]
MTTKCTGLMGRIFGHKFIVVMKPSGEKGLVDYRMLNMHYMRSTLGAIDYCICQRCGAVTGEKK